jgi:hypothetical protein
VLISSFGIVFGSVSAFVIVCVFVFAFGIEFEFECDLFNGWPFSASKRRWPGKEKRREEKRREEKRRADS